MIAAATEAPINEFGFISGPPSYGHENLIVLCIVTFLVAATMVTWKLRGERPFASLSLAGLTGFCSVAAACGIAEMFTYQLSWDTESSWPILAVAALAGGILSLGGAVLSILDRSVSNG